MNFPYFMRISYTYMDYGIPKSGQPFSIGFLTSNVESAMSLNY